MAPFTREENRVSTSVLTNEVTKMSSERANLQAQRHCWTTNGSTLASIIFQRKRSRTHLIFRGLIVLKGRGFWLAACLVYASQGTPWCKHSPDLLSSQPSHRQGGTGDKWSLLAAGRDKSKVEESVAQPILISPSRSAYLTCKTNSSRKRRKKNHYLLLCPLSSTQHNRAAPRLSVRHGLTTVLIAALELLTEADRSHLKVVTPVLQLPWG